MTENKVLNSATGSLKFLTGFVKCLQSVMLGQPFNSGIPQLLHSDSKVFYVGSGYILTCLG